MHQKSLNRAVVLGDDNEAFAQIINRAFANSHAEVDDRDSLATNMCNPADAGVQFGHHGQGGTLQHFTHFEYVDAKSLTSIETKQQQLQPVLPH